MTGLNPSLETAERVAQAQVVAFPRAASPALAPAPSDAPEAPAPQDDMDSAPDAPIVGEGNEVEASGKKKRRVVRDFIDEINSEYALVLMGSRAVVMRETPDAPIEDRVRVLSVDAFKTYLANRHFSRVVTFKNKDGEEDEKTVRVNYAKAWLQSPDRRTYDGIEFYPDRADASGTEGYFNLWRGFGVAPSTEPPADRAKKYSTFRDHVFTNIANGNEAHFQWIWHWFARIVQRPRERVGTSIVLRGKMGTGKTVAGDVIGSLFPSHYFLVDDTRYLTGNFNAHMASCLLLQVDEGFWAGDKAAEGRLKGLVTSKTQMIENKGVDPIRLTNYVSLLFSSNESWVVPAGVDERRFAVFDVGSASKENHGYFAELYKQLDEGGREALLADLLALDLNAQGAPDVRRIPKTSALLEQKLRSLDPVPAWWFERLNAGAATHRATKWRKKMPIMTLFNDYLRTAERIGIRRKSDQTAFGMAMRKLVPDLRTVKSNEEVETIGVDGRTIVETRRVNCWILPALEDCRIAFAEILTQAVEWESADDAAEISDENGGRAGAEAGGRETWAPEPWADEAPVDYPE